MIAGTRPFSVCVFCGSRVGQSPAFTAAARDFGRGIATRGWRLIYGGGDVGLMGELARSAVDAGGEVLGVIPQRLMDREVAKRDLTGLLVTDTMAERKRIMFAESDAYAVLPGGLGTLDEMLEVMTLKQLGYLASPILLVDIDGAWRTCIAMFEEIVVQGFAEPSALTLYATVTGIGAALDWLAATTVEADG